MQREPVQYPRQRATTVLLRSSDATYDASTKEYTYQFETPLVCNPDEQLTVELYSAAIPNSFYNIEAGRNSFDVTETLSGTTTTRTVNVTPGNYTVTTLRLELLSKLNSGTPQYTIDFNYTTGHFEFATATTGLTAVTFDVTGALRRSLGFTAAQHAFAGTPLTLTSDQVVDLSSNNHNILVSASFISNSFITSKDMRPNGIIAVIPISAQNFNLILYTQQEEFAVLLSNNRISQFSLRLQNQDGRDLEFNGVEWEVTLRFRFEKVPEFEDATLNLQRRYVRLQNRLLQQQKAALEQTAAATRREIAGAKKRVAKRRQQLAEEDAKKRKMVV